MFRISQAPTEIKSQPSIQPSFCLWQELSETDQEVIKGGPASLFLKNRGFGLLLKNRVFSNGLSGGGETPADCES